MVIDVHTHLAVKEIYPDSYITGMFDAENGNLNKDSIAAMISLFLKDNLSERLIKQMDQARIDKSVLLIIDGGVGMEEPVLSLDEIYKLHYKILQLYPERFMVLAGVDPRRGAYGFNLFKIGVIEYGFKGIKLYPPMGYAMDDIRLFDYYQICSDNNLSVLLHTGPSLPRLQNDYAKAENIYNVAREFPKVNFILAHAGIDPGVLDEKIYNLPNIYIDIAGFQSIYSHVNDQMIANFGLIFSEKYNSKVLFGSDWPLFNTINPIKKHINLIEELFDKVEHKISDGLENVLFKNAERALNLHA